MSLFRLAPRCSFLLRQPHLTRTFQTTSRLLSQESASTPSVLSSLQPDLKAALRSKDKPRLAVLRALLADITNASKTSTPVASDATFYLLLQKQIKASHAAVGEFQAAKRDDLVDKEKVQLAVLKEYRDRIHVLAPAAMASLVRRVVAEEKGRDEARWAAMKESARHGFLMGKTFAKVGGESPMDAGALKAVIEKVVAEGA